MSQLEIGQSLERLVGYMKIRLPVQPGFVSPTRGTQSTTQGDEGGGSKRWTIGAHRRSSRVRDSRDHLFEEFDPHVNKDNITVRTYAEVGSGPFSARR